LAAADRELVDAMLLSADRFVIEPGEAIGDVPSVAARRALLARLGMFGVRIALPLIRQGCNDASALSTELVRRSGLAELTDTLAALFAERAELLKARSGLLGLDLVVRAFPTDESDVLLGEIERITAGAHEFVELSLLASLRAGTVPLDADSIAEAERMLGGSGQKLHMRLGLDEDADPAALRAVATDALTRWRRRAENPVSVRMVADAARVIVRTCEGIIAGLHTD
jgi:hypothetical protein